MDKKKSNPKSDSLFHSSSWIHQAKNLKKETTSKENTKILKLINDYEIKCVYKINIEGYYKNVPIYRQNRNK